jgi:putative ABC transport system ATP-binding protein
MRYYAAFWKAKRTLAIPYQLRSFANRPRIILADEPTAALDSSRAQLVMDLLRKLATEQEACIVTISLDEKIFSRFDRLILVRDCQLIDP